MKIFAAFLVVVCVGVFGIILLTPATQGQKNQADEMTVIQRGKVTDKERAYSKEYKKLYTERAGGRLREMGDSAKANGPKGEINLALREGTIPTIQADLDRPLVDFLRGLSCEADAIVVGNPLSGSSHILDDESFVYTEYEFSVESILKNNADAPFEGGNSIAVTRPGGLVKLEGQVIRAGDERFLGLQKKQTHMLFLKYVPEADGYAATIPQGAFALQGGSFTKMWRQGAPKGLESVSDSTLFAAEVRKAVALGCVNPSKGGI